LKNTTVFLVEDDAFLQRALSRALRAAAYAVECHASAESLLEALVPAVESGQAACVLMDINLGGINGVDAQKLIRQLDSELPVIFMSAAQDARHVNQAWRDGASNFLFKPFTPQELLDALQQALQRRSQAPAASHAGREPAPEVSARVASLTLRQRQVFVRLAQGMTHLQIALALGISARTVKLHRAALMQRLQCRHLAELVRVHDACRSLLVDS
jgi:FixJ family two-component response regulator